MRHPGDAALKIRAFTLIVILAAAAAIQAEPNKARAPFSKPSRERLLNGIYDDRAVVKFVDGTAVRLRGAKLVVVDSELELDRAARQGVSRPKLDAQLATVNETLR